MLNRPNEMGNISVEDHRKCACESDCYAHAALFEVRQESRALVGLRFAQLCGQIAQLIVELDDLVGYGSGPFRCSGLAEPKVNVAAQRLRCLHFATLADCKVVRA